MFDLLIKYQKHEQTGPKNTKPTNWAVGKIENENQTIAESWEMAEGKGFEPPKGISSFNDLANRRLQPLGHPSAGDMRLCTKIIVRAHVLRYTAYADFFLASIALSVKYQNHANRALWIRSRRSIQRIDLLLVDLCSLFQFKLTWTRLIRPQPRPSERLP